jgi:transcriptional regulator with XRE-family HTH domain
MRQTELAQRLGINKSYLSMILSGQRIPNPELAGRLSSLGFVNFEARNSLRGRCPRPLDECATEITWLGKKDSNLRLRIQSPLSYH